MSRKERGMVAAERERYRRAWAQMSRLGALYFGLLFADFALFNFLGRMGVAEGWVVGLPFAVGALTVLFVGRRWLNYPCPRCGEPFRRNRQTGKHNLPLGAACANCQLIGGSLPAEEKE
jgi:hypothetical protein